MPKFRKLLQRLERQHGAPALPPAKGPFELVLWENCCYLLPDERRAEVFHGLRRQVGLDPRKILEADRAALLALARRRGMRPETRVFRWLEIARITLDQFAGSLDGILREPYAKAKKALRQFPNIGEPAAEKILLYCGVGEGVAGELPEGPAALARAHLLLRQHGKTICKEKGPACGECAAVDLCGYAAR